MSTLPQGSNVYDLTARESAWTGSPHGDLLIEAFKAIVQKDLEARLNRDASLPGYPAGAWVTLGHLAKQAINALENNPNFFVRWFRLVMVNPTDYRRWRDKAVTSCVVRTNRPTRRASQANIRRGIKEYIAAEFANGRRASQKRAWAWAKATMPGARYKQVIEAMSAAEGGKKSRGRPRASPPKE